MLIRRMVAVALFLTAVTGCGGDAADLIESLTGFELCGARVVQADLCPGTDGRLATCLAAGEENGVSAPTGVVACLVAHAPTEGALAYSQCVAECP